MFAHSDRPGFTFKRFHVAHDRCAMKVGTDGVLLGAWLAEQTAQRVLDIGCGSGLISLMLAQNFSSAIIDAIDIEAEAIGQAQENFKFSPWSQGLRAINTSLQDFQSCSYDLIVSNPPFFKAAHATSSRERHLARQDSQLPISDLFSHSHRLAHDNTLLGLVFPSHSMDKVAAAAQSYGWFLKQSTDVYTKASDEPHRCLSLWQRQALSCAPQCSNLVIHATDGGYSTDFIHLCGDFYLNM
ncbi:methyltransferase domain-containing protein [Alginatibacterium sediminis]|uniref:tRNA1(Val) (adenine(37)-N6)-methyltransferase n=1 Tax=Alginatibacterium sediminis TaxID=2164068 RepID=A0A420E8G4_9ALTE|nr:methyltransferase [Alginatibacterium sediminis]RKF15657.1 methyltransferase domain-containing protein [Alginatibacterium sediminis]